jgi:hypothetical protein
MEKNDDQSWESGIWVRILNPKFSTEPANLRRKIIVGVLHQTRHPKMKDAKLVTMRFPAKNGRNFEEFGLAPDPYHIAGYIAGCISYPMILDPSDQISSFLG